ncbi:sulfatase [Neorhodopirellula pilleata]|uniref:Arylsulfatase n=1 Tax=Neorhodopirellula pilleata TaxID=2714738 RepID=A0A5C6A6J8_9BACT|nr:sulfatase [Neorhodopirellula pilleata]TWT95139.1 Arylsulfatase [Neorhodopirellula pilleata]
MPARNFAVVFTLFLLNLGGISSAAEAKSSSRSSGPLNVVFILADDLGWSDTTLYGTTKFYRTPNLERLAARGVTFNRAYANSPLCSPTRASILTGQTPARHGSTAPQHHTGEVRLKASVGPGAPAGNKAIETQSVTRLDTQLPTLGKLIHTAGYKTGHFGKWHLGPEPYSPIQQGFDVDVPHHPGPGPAGSFVAPWKFANFNANYPGEHLEDRMAEEATSWMKSVADEPFFMNYWQFSVHAPFDAKASLIERYRGLVDPNDPQRSPTYAAMVHSFDDAIGTLLDAIDNAGIADQTVIILTSDNGGNMYNEVDGTTPTSNSPLRGGKASMFEGGIRVPCVVVWPGLTTAGTRSDEIIQTSDFYPTLLNQLGIAIPDDHPVDGTDITAALQGGKLDREAIFTFFPHSPPVPDWLPPSMSVHQGDYKLIRQFYQGENGQHDYLLFNLAEDIGETNNLAEQMPEKVKQLDTLIDQHIAETNAVIPVPNPQFDPTKYRPEQIGVGKIRNESAAPKPRKLGKPVAGWQAGGTNKVQQADKALVIRSTGNDPYIIAHHPGTFTGGPFTIRLKMKSDSSGYGQVFYNQPFSAEQSIQFEVDHDGQWHEYALKVPVETINALRLDPTRETGTIEVQSIRVENARSDILRSWDFAKD